MAKSQSPEIGTRLQKAVKKLESLRSMRNGTAVFHLTGENGGDFCIECAGGKATFREGAPAGRHLLEVWGDGKRIAAILEGKKDGRKQFLAGGIRIRGDLHYLSDVAMELGLIEDPL